MRGALFILIFTLFVLANCSSRPYVEPGNPSADARADQDIKECMAEGKDRVGTGQGKAAGKGTVIGGAAGASAGLISGLFSGSPVSSTLRGGAMGAAAGATGGAIHGAGGDSMYRNYVDRCLASRGHKVIGWR